MANDWDIDAENSYGDELLNEEDLFTDSPFDNMGVAGDWEKADEKANAAVVKTKKNYNKKYRQDHLELYKKLLNEQYKTVTELNSKEFLDTDSSGKSYNYVNKIPKHPDYRANLVCFKCQAPNCENVVCLGLPLCTRHWAEIGIVKKPAFRTIKGVEKSIGDGVFVAPGKCFPARYKIMQYVGELLTKDELDSVFPGDIIAPYSYQIPKQNKFISSERVRGMASYINHSKKPNVIVTAIKITNKFTPSEGERTLKVKNRYVLYVVSLKYLCAGEELLLDYGADYNVMATAQNSSTSEGKIKDEHHARSNLESKKPIINSVHGLEFPISHSNSTRFSFDTCPKENCTLKQKLSKGLTMYQGKRAQTKKKRKVQSKK